MDIQEKRFTKICYVKIKIINKGKVTIVVSFHEDE